MTLIHLLYFKSKSRIDCNESQNLFNGYNNAVKMCEITIETPSFKPNVTGCHQCISLCTQQQQEPTCIAQIFFWKRKTKNILTLETDVWMLVIPMMDRRPLCKNQANSLKDVRELSLFPSSDFSDDFNQEMYMKHKQILICFIRNYFQPFSIQNHKK